MIGFMGCGKSTMGRSLASLLNLTFIDLDIYIERKYFKTVPQIFAEEGEAEFRKKEHKVLEEVALFDDVIVATGGGAPCFFNNMDYLNEQGITVYLKASPEVLYGHLIIGKTERPLLKGKSPEQMMEYIKEQLVKREPFYSKARYTLNVDLMDNYEKIKISVDKIRELLNI